MPHRAMEDPESHAVGDMDLYRPWGWGAGGGAEARGGSRADRLGCSQVSVTPSRYEVGSSAPSATPRRDLDLPGQPCGPRLGEASGMTRLTDCFFH